jgi:hypothetical protein
VNARLVYVLGFGAGFGLMALLDKAADRYAFVLQRRMVIGWAEHFLCEAACE